MPLIYKGFAKTFAGLDHEIGPPPAVRVPGGRGYLRDDPWKKGAQKPYLDNVHFDIHDESWYTQEALRDRIAADPALHGRVYAGCAGSVNLDYIAASKAPAALLFDINPLQKLFWDDMIAMLAALPDRGEFARMLPLMARTLYYKIELLHGREAIKGFISPPVPDENERYRYGDGDRSSPFRGMSYRRFEEWIDYRLSDRFDRGTGSWIREDHLYRHLHLLAKNGALAALTVDIRDRAMCRRIGQRLGESTYEVIDEGGVSQGTATGAKVGFLYRSNVGHYLKWSGAEIAAQKEKGGVASDYSGRPVSTATYRQAQRNLRYWFDPANSHMIASDTGSGGLWGQFRPRLRAVRPFTPPAP